MPYSNPMFYSGVLQQTKSLVNNLSGMMSAEPDYGEALGLIRHLPTEELRDLVNNEDKLTDLMKDLPQVYTVMLCVCLFCISNVHCLKSIWPSLKLEFSQNFSARIHWFLLYFINYRLHSWFNCTVYEKIMKTVIESLSQEFLWK